ncbi:MAG: M20/M25/M40 family metallo-hydrolase [Planctomycetes bacterium]|nr:M20/M25/M40 family metallo-hydrolase [Planctomycetota bacterium]
MSASPLHQHVLDLVDTEAIARDTLEFVRVKSETGQEGPGSLFLFELMKREGLDPELHEVEPNRPNVYARLPGRASPGRAPSLVMNGHTDTIPIGNSNPPGRDGDWIIGRGTEDMKGGLVAMVHATSALRRAGVPLAGDLWLTGVIGHEAPAGKKEGPERLIRDLRSGRVRADAVLIVEGPAAIWAASLGLSVFTVTLTDSRGPVHTIKVPYAQNPACWVGRILQKFEAMEQAFEAGPRHPLCGREQLNVGVVRGGDYFNRLPHVFTLAGTRRWNPGKTVADVHAEFKALFDDIARRSGLQYTIAYDGEREPFETSPDHPIVRSLKSAGNALTGKTPEIIGMGLVGDANLYANEAGVPAVYYGPAHETAHSDHERVSASQLAHCARVYALAAIDFCGVE